MRMLGALLRPQVRTGFRYVRDPLVMRRAFDKSARFFWHVPFTVLSETNLGPLGGAWVSAGPVKSDRVLLYFHGGGYFAGGPQTHFRMVARLCRMTGMRAYMPRYRLAPEALLPAALEDAVEAFKALRHRGYRADQIIIGGDSAGGGLTLSLLAVLCDAGEQPAAAFVYSPFTDLTFSGASVQENTKSDHFFPGDLTHELTTIILGEADASDPRVSPLFAEFPDCPPVLFQVSDCEILRDDSVRLAEKLSAIARVQMWHGLPHVWQIFDGWVPEARQALKDTAAFIRDLPPSKS